MVFEEQRIHHLEKSKRRLTITTKATGGAEEINEVSHSFIHEIRLYVCWYCFPQEK